MNGWGTVYTSRIKPLEQIRDNIGNHENPSVSRKKSTGREMNWKSFFYHVSMQETHKAAMEQLTEENQNAFDALRIAEKCMKRETL